MYPTPRFAVIRRHPWYATGVSLAIVVLLFFLYSSPGSTKDTAGISVPPPLVSLTTAAQFSGDTSLRLIGNVRALAEAEITAERSGQVVRVGTTLGATVTAGQVIAILENAAERAAVLQAEGVYEAALAAASVSTIGVSEAKSNLQNVENATRASVLSAYTTVNDLVRNTIDSFFTNPESGLIGLRIDGKGYTATLNSERLAYQTLLSDWQRQTQSPTTASDLDSDIALALRNTGRTIQFIDTFITVFSSQGTSAQYTDTELATFRNTFSAAKATLIATVTALNNSQASLNAARDTLLRADANAVGSGTSSADAQVKQALGILRSAEASLAKTVLRSPISGTVNSLSIKAGDYVTSGTRGAVIANNQALEIVTYINNDERSRITVGDTFTVDRSGVATVRQIAPALDPVTRKIELRLVTESESIKNGDTVNLTSTTDTPVISEVVRVPITALKFEAENGYLLTVVDNELTKLPVTIGQISGNLVTITTGLAANESFVVDVRGLQTGERVTVQE